MLSLCWVRAQVGVVLVSRLRAKVRTPAGYAEAEAMLGDDIGMTLGERQRLLAALLAATPEEFSASLSATNSRFRVVNMAAVGDSYYSPRGGWGSDAEAATDETGTGVVTSVAATAAAKSTTRFCAALASTSATRANMVNLLLRSFMSKQPKSRSKSHL